MKKDVITNKGKKQKLSNCIVKENTEKIPGDINELKEQSIIL